MPKFYALVLQVSKNTYLIVASFEIKYATYTVQYGRLEVIKACGEGGFSFSRPHFIAEATSPMRS
jgi:hypothetical protein